MSKLATSYLLTMPQSIPSLKHADEKTLEMAPAARVAQDYIESVGSETPPVPSAIHHVLVMETQSPPPNVRNVHEAYSFRGPYHPLLRSRDTLSQSQRLLASK